MYTSATILAAVFVALVWKFRPRRSGDPGFKFVYVNQDGSVRELSPKERDYLSRKFAPTDGAQPYIKRTYASIDGWGSQSGFIKCRRVPPRLEILPVNPGYEMEEDCESIMEIQRATGDAIETLPNGVIRCTPNRSISREERFELARNCYLEKQREREALAKI
ncbi:MAG TPA: hypothetical protein VGH90_08915 [Chthoniobacteraceae bacterium]|jgi:hypothetical protein